jgi:hypothetical protein
MRSTLLVSVLATLLAPSIEAQTLHVPGDHPDLQAALDAAPPGARIHVHGGTFATITIAKPVTLLAHPPVTIEGEGGPFLYTPPITLAGPGSGEVVLDGVVTGGVANGTIQSQLGPGIVGGGFDELHVLDCTIRAPIWCCVTGLGEGRPGLDVTVPFTLVERSLVVASGNEPDGLSFSGWPGAPGLRSTGTVTLLDSTLTGGNSGTYFFPGPACGGGPCPTGDGGAGLQAAELYHAGSTITGGSGAVWLDDMGVFCCANPPAPALDVGGAIVALPADLELLGPVRIGERVRLTLRSPGPTATLLVALNVDAPVIVGTIPGVRFLTGVMSLGPVATPGTVEVPIPWNLDMIGRELAFQLLDPTTGYSRPVVDLLEAANVRKAP